MSQPVHHMGELLGNNATVVDHHFVVEPDGSTREIVIDSQGNRTESFIHGPGTPGANELAITERSKANVAAIEAWIAANPHGAALTPEQSLVFARAIVGLSRLIHRHFEHVGGA